MSLRRPRRRGRPGHRRLARRRARRAPRGLLGPGPAVARHPRAEPGRQPGGPSAWRWGRPSCRSALDQFADELPPEFRRLGELYIARNRDIGGAVERGRAHVDPRRQPHRQPLRRRRSDRVLRLGCRQPVPRHARRRLLPLQLAARPGSGAPKRSRSWPATEPASPHGGVDARRTSSPTEQYRLFSVYSWISATTTAAMGSKWQPAEVGRKATKRTTQAIIDLDVLGLLGARLGTA